VQLRFRLHMIAGWSTAIEFADYMTGKGDRPHWRAW
jgi:hypothetical protein